MLCHDVVAGVGRVVEGVADRRVVAVMPSFRVHGDRMRFSAIVADGEIRLRRRLGYHGVTGAHFE